MEHSFPYQDATPVPQWVAEVASPPRTRHTVDRSTAQKKASFIGTIGSDEVRLLDVSNLRLHPDEELKKADVAVCCEMVRAVFGFFILVNVETIAGLPCARVPDERP